MFLRTVQPKWKHLRSLQTQDYVHFNLQTLGLTYQIPTNFVNSFKHLHPDLYVNKKIVRSRKYAHLQVNIQNPNKYHIFHTQKNTFTQNVKDERSFIRTFELIDSSYLNQSWLLDFITQTVALSTYHAMSKTNLVDVHIHQIRQITYPHINSHNSPEGIHKDGADTIVSAFVIQRQNCKGGESIIYDKEKHALYKTKLDDKQGIFMEDKQQYHYVTPIVCDELTIGYRDIIGLDIIMN